jgi:hypothetical protein
MPARRFPIGEDHVARPFHRRMGHRLDDFPVWPFTGRGVTNARVAQVHQPESSEAMAVFE